MPDPVPSSGRDVAEALTEATRRLLRTADSLTDDDLRAPSLLPGWTRGHVLAHLALNGEGLAGALTGIVEGRQVPMYASQEARDADIEVLAAHRPTDLRDRLLGASTALGDALAAVPDDRWDTAVERVPGGPTFTAADVPSMRLREVEIHHVDLDAGYDRAGWDPAFAAQVLDRMLVRDAADAPFSACATDLGRTWEYGAGGPTVSGTSRDLAWWLTGRGTGEGLTSDGGDLPRIGAW